MTSPELDRTLLGQRLKQAREYLELSQEEVARTVGIPRPAVSLIESGLRGLDTIELTKLAALYQRSVSYFTGDSTTPPVPAEVEHLARAMNKLTDRDREELARFVEFLGARSAGVRSNAE